MGRARRLPRMQPPVTVEREYFGGIMAFVAGDHGSLRALYPEIAAMARSARAERGRHDLDEGASITARIAKIRDRANGPDRQRQVRALADRMARRTVDFNGAQLASVMAASTDKDRAALLAVRAYGGSRRIEVMARDFAFGNANLIAGITDKAASDVSAIVVRAYQEGRRSSDIQGLIEDRLDTDERRAALIARDQIGSLNGQVNAARQEALGITKFIWRTVNDSRVRDEHADLDGNEFEYSDPPGEGLPGEPINCRCYAEPVFEF